MKKNRLELTSLEAFKVDLYFWLQALVLSLVSLILLFTFAGRMIGVVGTSMVPTLHDRDMLLLRSFAYRPSRGDIVVLTKRSFMEQPIVKRVIAVGGQQVEINYTQKTVHVDGVLLNEPYINEAMHPPFSEHLTSVTVPKGSIFVMGDNRNHSSDSRDIRLGVVDERYILGQAIFVLFPLENIKNLTQKTAQAENPAAWFA